MAATPVTRVTPLSMPDPGATRSFWLQEALAHDPVDACRPLTGRVSADVCIVGGGFAGLWTAVELSEREPDLRIAVVEQDICGGGASGRNGGFFSSSWWDAPATCALFGDDEGMRYLHAVADTVAEAGAWLETNGVDAWFHHEGTMRVATGTWQTDVDETSAGSFLDARGLGDRLRPISLDEARAIADSPRFVQARFGPDGAIVQPARLARGLRRIALERGVHIFERTAMIGLDRSRPAVVRTTHGAVKAGQVVLATGAWAAGWRGFGRSFGVIADHVVATEPIPDRLEEIGWRSHVGIGDGRELVYYLRPTDDGRIVIGGGALGVVFGGKAGGRAASHDRRVAEAAARGLLWLFPQLEGVRFTHAWGGPIDQTATFLPFFRTLEPGNVHAGLGFSGHGLSQTMLGGRILASLVQGLDDEWTSMPVVGDEAKSPPEPLRYPLVWLSSRSLEAGDRRADAGRSRGVLLDAAGYAPSAYREHIATRAARRRG
ncbi:MAG TPA: FAD-dependent oxidoreductase [Actinomycetota bacterium]